MCPAAVMPLGVSLLVALATTVRAQEWRLPAAPLRFTLELAAAPTPAEAGFFVQLPDGGVLPKPYPLTQVVDEAGNTLASYALWHNPVSGLALVFEAPQRGSKVTVYVGNASRLRLWTPESGLKPSAILCADPTTDRMVSAQQLATLGPVGPAVHSAELVGHPKAAFSIAVIGFGK